MSLMTQTLYILHIVFNTEHVYNFQHKTFIQVMCHQKTLTYDNEHKHSLVREGTSSIL
jgi:hypothetical protein